MGNAKTERNKRRKRRNTLRGLGFSEQKIARMVDGSKSATERALDRKLASAHLSEDVMRSASDDCPDYYRDMLGDDADYLWTAGIDDIGCK